MFFKQQCPNKYGLGLSNEILFIIIAQRAPKLWSVKVGDLKKISDPTPDHSQITRAAEFFSDFQLWQVTVLEPFELWWWIVAHLKAPSHTCLDTTKKQQFKVRNLVLKSTNLLHKRGFDDFQSSTTAVGLTDSQIITTVTVKREKLFHFTTLYGA